MKKVRITATVLASERDRLADQAAGRGLRLNVFLRKLILAGAELPEPESVEELRQARAEASRRSRELGEARREIRELKARLNSLLASAGDGAAARPPWSLDHSRSSAEEVEAWWRWLEAGVRRLRRRYGVVEVKSSGGYGERDTFWWENEGRVRLLAALTAWDEMLDRGGESVPNDPRLVQGFLDYLGRVSAHFDAGLVRIGLWFESQQTRELEDHEAGAFQAHLREVLHVVGDRW